MTDTEQHAANRLIHETSPYLLQHAHNPVDWYPWGQEALARAREEQRLILLSIGYSACHWCHVMERESFENDAIAALMNEGFVNIKVDREERPDLDDIYMAATVAMNSGQGGWPMTVFLTPDLEPVFAGTYFPPDDRYGRTGFPRLLHALGKAWDTDREKILEQAKQFADQLRAPRANDTQGKVGQEQVRLAGEQFGRDFDARYGGFGQAPKFPLSVSVMLLLRLHHSSGQSRYLEMATKTLQGMADGGMYDHIGGGFCRYSTDERWLVPHFEKMLYDNALLCRAYLEAFQITGESLFVRVARETLDYVIDEMTSDQGGFFSSTDADSEGIEGKFFVWRPDEIDALLPEADREIFKLFYDITEEGNWEGNSIPHTPHDITAVAKRFDEEPARLRTRLDGMRRIVFNARTKRIKPALDDKILTAWNGLMIGAFAEGYRVLGDDRYRDAASRAADFVLSALTDDDGKLLRTHRHGRSHLDAYLEDYAYLAEGLLDLYEVTGTEQYLSEAERLADEIANRFLDEESGAFFHTSHTHEELLFRFREGADGATPAPNAVAAYVLARLAVHLDRAEWRAMAARAIDAYGAPMGQYPRAFSKSITVVDWLSSPPAELAFVGDENGVSELVREAARVFVPHKIQAISHRGNPTTPLLAGKKTVSGKAALYICRDFSCQAPITEPGVVADALRSQAVTTAQGTS